MGINQTTLRTTVAAGLAAVAFGCAPADGNDAHQQWLEENKARQDYLDSINGLISINGLTSTNGLMTINGLVSVNGLVSTNGAAATNGLPAMNGMTAVNGLPAINGMTAVNGMTAINGLPAINGMTAINGLPAINGMTAVNGITAINGLYTTSDGTATPVDPNATLPVDCGASGVPGKDCWGFAEGILNPQTGLLASDAGIMVAKYMVRCALPSTQSVNLMDYTGHVLHLNGEIGFAPEWQTGLCVDTCQEKVSACLMALTNGSGRHVQLDLSATFNVGTGTSSAYTKNEAMWYGNLFLQPPAMNYALGTDSDGLLSLGWADGTLRCTNTTVTPNIPCPYYKTGNAYHYYFIWQSDQCDSSDSSLGAGTAKACRGQYRKNTIVTNTTYLTSLSTGVPVASTNTTYLTTKSSSCNWLLQCTTTTKTTGTQYSTVTVTPTSTLTTGTNYQYSISTGGLETGHTFNYPITTYVATTGGA